eukprot:79103_1
MTNFGTPLIIPLTTQSGQAVMSHLDRSTYDMKDWKVEEEEEQKYHFTNEKKADHSLSTDFRKPHIDDYLHCGDIRQCNAVQRVIHLLAYYKHNESLFDDSDETIVFLYEYIMSLSKYTISTFMEDWYHSKTKHFKTADDYEWLENDKTINCEYAISKTCRYIDRHKRQRRAGIYDINKDIDHKNIILRDQIDSIHAFIFHSKSLRNNDIRTHDGEDNDSDLLQIHVLQDDIQKREKNNHKLTKRSNEKQSQIWSNNPKSLTDCNVLQILYILDEEETFNTLDKLLMHKNDIANYINDKSLDGAKLSEVGRKTFLDQISDHLNDKKLKGKLGKLYNNIIHADLSRFTGNSTIENNLEDDIWCNNPSLIKECNLKQILYILNHEPVFNGLDKLTDHKDKIINYIKQNDLN